MVCLIGDAFDCDALSLDDIVVAAGGLTVSASLFLAAASNVPVSSRLFSCGGSCSSSTS